MDLYTLSPSFLPKDQIDDFVSAIWTERYWSAGDTQLVMASTASVLEATKPGTYLALRGTKEVMELRTQEIEKGLVTIKGASLPTFLNQRAAWFRNPAAGAVPADERIMDYTQTAKPGEFLADVVTKSVITPVPFVGDTATANLDWALEKIPFLTLGPVDASGVAERLTLSAGPLYDSLQRIAEAAKVGFTLYLESATSLGYSLKFTTYQGLDRTSSQAVNKMVRLSPNLETLGNLKEVRSNEIYKNVAYVYYQGIVTKHLAEPTLPEPEGFNRRVLIINPETEPVGRPLPKRDYWNWHDLGQYIYVGPAEIAAFRAQVAKDAFANANYIKSIDGQTNPGNEYVYGIDFGMGDVIELEGLTGVITKARITEHIRSQDQYGEKSFPTISVL